MTIPALFFSLMMGWSAVWSIVLFEYARAAHRSWRVRGGSWRRVPGELWRAVSWYFERIGGDIICVVKKCPPETRPHYHQYDGGHYLRLFIGMSAFHSGLFGFLTAAVDRTAWPHTVQLVALFSITVSTMAGVGHLFVAWTHCARRWRVLVLLMLLWFPLGVVLYRSLHGGIFPL